MNVDFAQKNVQIYWIPTVYLVNDVNHKQEGLYISNGRTKLSPGSVHSGAELFHVPYEI